MVGFRLKAGVVHTASTAVSIIYAAARDSWPVLVCGSQLHVVLTWGNAFAWTSAVVETPVLVAVDNNILDNDGLHNTLAQ